MLGSSMTVTSTITLTAGTLDTSVSNFNIKLLGGWVGNGGTFAANGSTVTLAGTSASSKITVLVNRQVIPPATVTTSPTHFWGPGGRRGHAPAGSSVSITIPAHSYRAFATEK